MFPSFLLALREGLEAALIIGIVLGALRQMKRQDLAPAIWGGVLAAVLFSVFAALILTFVGAKFEGRAEQIFEGIAMLFAAGILTWMIFWMHRHARFIKQSLTADVSQAMKTGGGKALFILAFLTVGREGLELALFLVATGMVTGGMPTLVGAFAGLLVSVALGWVLFASTYRLDLRNFFLVTNILLIIFAAGLVAHGVHEFNEAGMIPSIVEHVWDINHLLDETSTLGSFMKALFGYNGNPSLTEVLAYFIYLGVIVGSIYWFTRREAQVGPQQA